MPAASQRSGAATSATIPLELHGTLDPAASQRSGAATSATIPLELQGSRRANPTRGKKTHRIMIRIHGDITSSVHVQIGAARFRIYETVCHIGSEENVDVAFGSSRVHGGAL